MKASLCRLDAPITPTSKVIPAPLHLYLPFPRFHPFPIPLTYVQRHTDTVSGKETCLLVIDIGITENDATLKHQCNAKKP